MTNETGAHARQRMPAPRLSVLLLVFVYALIAAPDTSPAAQPSGSTTEKEKTEDRVEASLRAPMAAIAKAFRTEKSKALMSLLPAEGKVFLALGRLGGGASGYYGRDQVYFIFHEIFSERETVRFDIRPRSPGRAEKEKDRENLIYCIGRWSFRRQDGNTGSCRIHFALSMRKDSWTLVEIREAR